MGLKVLVIYHSQKYIAQKSLTDNIYSFRRYSTNDVYHLNLFFSRRLRYLHKVHFDIVIIHFTLLYSKEYVLEKYYKFLIKNKFPSSVKVGIFQDEWYKTDFLCKLINELDITYVFSVSPKSELKKLYSNIDFNKVKFFKVLTGYIDNKSLDRIQRIHNKITRNIDVGYRAIYEPKRFYHGEYYHLKGEIGIQFEKQCNKFGLNYDISLKEKDFLFGSKWFKFLYKCKYTLGIESGVSLIDRDGSIRRKTNKFIENHPEADYEEVAANCFTKKDDRIAYFAIAPRHLEACITKTCQVLTEGEYNGILKAGIHYIELKKNFSNLDEVMKLINRDEIRETVIENAYQDIVSSGKYTYKSYVDYVFGNIEIPEISKSFKSTAFLYKRLFINEELNLIKAFVYSIVLYPIYRFIRKYLSPHFLVKLRKFFKV